MDNIIVVLLVVIWINNTRYGSMIGDVIHNAIKSGLHPVKRIIRKVIK